MIEEVRTVDEMATAIKEMHVRGAGLIGAAAGYGMYLATLGAEGHSIEDQLAAAAQQLKATRPTAVNLAWAIERQLKSISAAEDVAEKRRVAFETARQIADEDAEYCRRIGEHGLELIRRLSEEKRRRAGQCAHALQRRLAGVCGTSVAPPHLCMPRRLKEKNSTSLSAGRDASTLARRDSHRLGVCPAKNIPPDHRRQRCRPSHAAR